MASNMQGALDARAKLASPARQEDEERDEKRLSKADRTARATSSATFFNSIGHERPKGDVPIVLQKSFCTVDRNFFEL